MLAILCNNWFLFCSWTATPKHLGVIYTDTSNWRVLFTISTYHFYNVGQRLTESWLSLSYNIFSWTKLLCSSNNIIEFFLFLFDFGLLKQDNYISIDSSICEGFTSILHCGQKRSLPTKQFFFENSLFYSIKFELFFFGPRHTWQKIQSKNLTNFLSRVSTGQQK
jgi:hypothetical protein